MTHALFGPPGVALALSISSATAGRITHSPFGSVPVRGWERICRIFAISFSQTIGQSGMKTWRQGQMLVLPAAPMSGKLLMPSSCWLLLRRAVGGLHRFLGG